METIYVSLRELVALGTFFMKSPELKWLNKVHNNIFKGAESNVFGSWGVKPTCKICKTCPCTLNMQNIQTTVDKITDKGNIYRPQQYVILKKKSTQHRP